MDPGTGFVGRGMLCFQSLPSLLSLSTSSSPSSTTSWSPRQDARRGLIYAPFAVGGELKREDCSVVAHSQRGRRTTRMLAGAPSSSVSGDTQWVMVNGIPGKMAAETAEAVVRRGLSLVPFALTGNATEQEEADISGNSVKLIKPDARDEVLAEVKQKYPNVICVDYTHPSAANANANAYAKAGLSFVIGTTGGDAQRMEDDVLSVPDVYAVIAPNMGKQIVAFQAMIDQFSKDFPGALEGYEMSVVESHQAWKADTSGTAKAIIGSFNRLGVDFSVDEVEKVRTELEQRERIQVPQEYLRGHAYHTYTLTSPDGTVTLQFQHNVRGRRVYAEGTVDALLWLAKQRLLKIEKRVFSMIDILRTGVMK